MDDKGIERFATLKKKNAFPGLLIRWWIQKHGSLLKAYVKHHSSSWGCKKKHPGKGSQCPHIHILRGVHSRLLLLFLRDFFWVLKKPILRSPPRMADFFLVTWDGSDTNFPQKKPNKVSSPTKKMSIPLKRKDASSNYKFS